MKNKISDVRDYLVQALEDLSDDSADATKMAMTIDRAKTISLVSGTYIQAIKSEVDAIRVAAATGYLPSSVEPGTRLLNADDTPPKPNQPRIER